MKELEYTGPYQACEKVVVKDFEAEVLLKTGLYKEVSRKKPSFSPKMSEHDIKKVVEENNIPFIYDVTRMKKKDALAALTSLGYEVK